MNEFREVFEKRVSNIKEHICSLVLSEKIWPVLTGINTVRHKLEKMRTLV